jgi:hypothetical protein
MCLLWALRTVLASNAVISSKGWTVAFEQRGSVCRLQPTARVPSCVRRESAHGQEPRIESIRMCGGGEFTAELGRVPHPQHAQPVIKRVAQAMAADERSPNRGPGDVQLLHCRVLSRNLCALRHGESTGKQHVSRFRVGESQQHRLTTQSVVQIGREGECRDVAIVGMTRN